ncbi:MAG: hypothetical protein Q9182_006249 [Xanthomendoza sp. 2 TL-2023]
MALAGSLWKTAQDSPSRQLLWELNRLVLSEQEESFQRLDRESQQREAAHKNALAEAIARHDKVRNDAEAERDRHERQQQQERAQREEEQRQQAEREKQAELERERAAKRRLAEQAEAAARAERAATQEREAEEAREKAEKDRREARAVQEKKEEQEAADRKRVSEERKAKIENSAAAARPTPTSKTIQSATSEPAANTLSKITLDPGREAEHQRYLGIHQTLKELRKFMMQQAKQNPALKEKMGDMRRELRKSVGQLREGKGKNTPQVSARTATSFEKRNNLLDQNNAIMTVLREALKSFPEPKVGLAKFVARPVEDLQAPALVIYLLNHLSKAIISQLIKEASVSPRLAEPIGVAAVNFFARDEFRVNGVSLIDILIAKYHVVCPPIFGIYGSESSDQGRERLGWWREEAGGPWISEQLHQDRMTGLGAGYAAISLRTFENSRMINPYPPYHFWRALAAILNVPAGQVTDTHFILLRALIENSEQRFLLFFGDSAKQLMRFAIVEYPKRASKDSVAAKVLSNLGNTMKKDKKLYL